MTKNKIFGSAAALVVVVTLGYLFLDGHLSSYGYGSKINGLIERNITAKGGSDTWRNVESLRLSGQMDLGQGLRVPYFIEQKRPGKMCLEYEFDRKMAIQCVDGDSGWRLLPFRGQVTPVAMSSEDALKMSDTASIDSLLFAAAKRGYQIELLGEAEVSGRMTDKLKISMPGGTQRWLYLDKETGLEVKLESRRVLRGEEKMVETLFSDWMQVNGLLIAGRQETRTSGDNQSQFVTVEHVDVNPAIENDRFVIPSERERGI